MINNIFVIIAGEIESLLYNLGLPELMVNLLMASVYASVLAGLIAVLVIVLVLAERKTAGFMQRRPGPNRVGPHGMFQIIADMLKIFGKESIIPAAADKVTFILAPIIIFVPTLLAYAVIPFGEGMIAADLNLGVFYFIAVSSLATLPLFLAGWASNNKYSLLGGMRAVAQMVSYELPLIFSILGVIMIAGSMRMNDIVLAQSGLWFVFLQPVAFIIFFISALAELNRAPFDLPEGETELTAGVFTEYSPIKFSLFQMAEYGNIFIMSGFMVTLFLGGWQAPFGLTFIPSYVWFFGKVFAVIFVIFWIRWTFPRIRVDKLMNFGWKLLLPAAIANIILTGAGFYLFLNYAG